MSAVTKLWRANMPVVTSQLLAKDSDKPSNYLLRAVLDVVVSGLATKCEEIERFLLIHH
jgi:hypothetical protein